ncbi:kinase-like protein, partial [Rhizoclosmatium globosum]
MTLQHLVDNDYKILNALELKQVEYLEAIDALQKHISEHLDAALERNLERIFCDKALANLRRATAATRIAGTGIPKHQQNEEWLVTSWEFEIGPLISRGGFGEVLKATWLGHSSVAVKRLHIRLETAKLRDDFYREVKTWFPLRHPNILPLLGACANAERPFMVSPFMERGHALQYLEWIGDGHGSIEHAGIKLLYEVSLGIQYLHARGVTHGDLKAVNILVDEYGKACVADFGFAQLKRYTTTKTTAGSSTPFGGTLRWMSPERLQGAKLAPPVDTYAFAMTCYEILTEGDVPFTETPDALIYQHVVNSNIRPEMPDAANFVSSRERMWTLMSQCWQPDPMARPPFS